MRVRTPAGNANFAERLYVRLIAVTTFTEMAGRPGILLAAPTRLTPRWPGTWPDQPPPTPGPPGA